MTTLDETLKKIEGMTYQYYLDEMLKRIPNDIDSREGSIVFDALAPVAYGLAEMTVALHGYIRNAYTNTAVGEFLDLKAAERGITREPAVGASVKVELKNSEDLPLTPAIGDRFASNETAPHYYAVTEILSDGQVIMSAETKSISANVYKGQLLPITPQNGLKSAMIVEFATKAKEAETDDSLRARILGSNQTIAFAGNIAAYQKEVDQIDGVGAVQVYPAWQGGGTVKIVILDNGFDIASRTLLDKVQSAIDPLDSQAQGRGLAPIGHTVTVTTAVARQVDINATIELDPGASRPSIEAELRQALDQYFLALRQSWSQSADGRSYAQTIYRSQILAKILSIKGIVNVSHLRLDNLDKDIVLTFDNHQSQLATLGKVVIDYA